MAYRFKLNERMDSGFRRIATGQIDRAIAHQQAVDGDAVLSVHETRKCLKRTRALLRFCRPMIGNAAFKAHNAALRDIGREMSATRDLDVLVQTAQLLAAEGAIKPPAAKRLQAALLAASRSRQGANEPGLDSSSILARLVAERDALANAVIDDGAHELTTDGIAHGLDACRATFDIAFSGDDDDAIHEWRKAVQIHWRHMQLVSRAWPDFFAVRIDEARSISALIGEERDLGLLQIFAAAAAVPKLPVATLRAIDAAISARRVQLREQARLRGQRLLADGTGGLCRRISVYWDAAVEMRASSSAEPALHD
jgi:CHAD domain-containing protein